jgi:hypothetical protein
MFSNDPSGLFYFLTVDVSFFTAPGFVNFLIPFGAFQLV